MDYNKQLTQSINSKFGSNIIKQFGVIENDYFLMDSSIGCGYFFMSSSIGKKLKELFDKLIIEHNKFMNTNLTAEYYLFGIKRNIDLKENHQILDTKLIELLNDNQNIDLRNSFENIINYIDLLHYVENDSDYSNEFTEIYNMMIEILNDKNTNVNDLECGINFFEGLKNNFRDRNQQAFEFYDKLQKKYYQLLETNFNVKYNVIQDYWNKFL